MPHNTKTQESEHHSVLCGESHSARNHLAWPLIRLGLAPLACSCGILSRFCFLVGLAAAIAEPGTYRQTMLDSILRTGFDISQRPYSQASSRLTIRSASGTFLEQVPLGSHQAESAGA